VPGPVADGLSNAAIAAHPVERSHRQRLWPTSSSLDLPTRAAAATLIGRGANPDRLARTHPAMACPGEAAVGSFR
jgi:hypothetical protein